MAKSQKPEKIRKTVAPEKLLLKKELVELAIKRSQQIKDLHTQVAKLSAENKISSHTLATTKEAFKAKDKFIVELTSTLEHFKTLEKEKEILFERQTDIASRYKAISTKYEKNINEFLLMSPFKRSSLAFNFTKMRDFFVKEPNVKEPNVE